MILAIDQSYSNTGLARIEEDGKIYVYSVKTSREEPWSVRISKILAGVQYMINGSFLERPTKPQVAVIEGYAMAAKGRVFNLGELGGIIKMHLLKQVTEVHRITPKHHKMFVAHYGNIDKIGAMVALKSRFSIDVEDDNIADAICMGLLMYTALQYKAGKKQIDTYEKMLFERMGIFSGRTNIEYVTPKSERGRKKRPKRSKEVSDKGTEGSNQGDPNKVGYFDQG